MDRFLLGYNTSGFSRCPDIDAIAGWTAEAGFSAIEISFTPEHVMPEAGSALDRLARLCRARKLAVACGAGARHALGPVPHRPSWVSEDPWERRARMAFMLDAVTAAARLGSKILVFHSGPRLEGTSEQAAWDHLRDGLARLVPAAARAGVTPALEFHPSMLVAGRPGTAPLLADFPGLRLTLDIGHLQCTEGPPLAAGIRDSLPMTAHIHLEDIRGRVHEHLPIGDGDIPFGEVFQALFAGGYAGIVAAEFHSRSIDLDERELARRTFSRLSTLLGTSLFRFAPLPGSGIIAPQGGVMTQPTGYCMKCKKTVEIVNGQETTMKNGRKALKGKCASCGTGIYRILGK